MQLVDAAPLVEGLNQWALRTEPVLQELEVVLHQLAVFNPLAPPVQAVGQQIEV